MKAKIKFIDHEFSEKDIKPLQNNIKKNQTFSISSAITNCKLRVKWSK